jgi:hypothetical protein
MSRRNWWRLIAIAALLLTGFSRNPEPSLACSCASGVPDVDVVFVGRVVTVLEGKWAQRRLRRHHDGFGSTVALLRVDLMWQGASRPYFFVVGGTGQGDCTLHFEPGSHYLVYGLRREFGPLHTNTCIGSRPMDGQITPTG